MLNKDIKEIYISPELEIARFEVRDGLTALSDNDAPWNGDWNISKNSWN